MLWYCEYNDNWFRDVGGIKTNDMAYIYSVYNGCCIFFKLIMTYAMSCLQGCETLHCGSPGL